MKLFLLYCCVLFSLCEGDSYNQEFKDMMDIRMSDLEEKISEMEAKFEIKEADMRLAMSKSVRDLPYVSICGYQGVWYDQDATITYSKLISDYKNDDSYLTPETGVFYARTSGYYTITFSGVSTLEPGQEVTVYLYRNNIEIFESAWLSAAQHTSGRVDDQGSRSLILHLNAGDYLNLRTTKVDDSDSFTGYLWRPATSISHRSLVCLRAQSLATRTAGFRTPLPNLVTASQGLHDQYQQVLASLGQPITTRLSKLLFL